MGRSRSKKNRSQTTTRNWRDTRSITNTRVLPVSLNLDPLAFARTPSLLGYEDRRLWNPYPSVQRPARTFSKPYHQLVVPSSRRTVQTRRNKSYVTLTYPTARIGFAQPSRTLICVRRNIRKQVLHAFRKTGKIGQRRPRFNQYSKITCRR